MSLLYKGEIEEDTKFAVMIFTTEDENDIKPLNMQISYTLYGSKVQVTNDLPACAAGSNELDD